MIKIKFSNTYSKLPESFYQRIDPSVAKVPQLIAFNKDLADFLQINYSETNEQEFAETFSGKVILPGSEPLAQAYAGHQFGHWVPRLGDGRAILLGEVKAKDGLSYDLHLKGAGQTKFSRRGDGRSSLGPVLREFIVSEAMFHLGVPTTRSLAAVATGETVYREEAVPGAVLTRVAKSHLRVGTFEYFANQENIEDLKVLADYAINKHDPEISREEDKYFLFFCRVAERQINLVTQWLGLGFIHGVMNTDNTSISGETIDYGPCAFMDEFQYNKVFSSIDSQGRYAYANQGNVILWNLSILVNALFPLLETSSLSEEDLIEKIKAKFDGLKTSFEEKHLVVMANKLGISKPNKHDVHLVREFLDFLQAEKLDFTNSFRDLSYEKCLNKAFLDKWKYRISQETNTLEEIKKNMRAVNPYLIPRNHQIEKAIQQANNGDFSHFQKLNRAYLEPYKESEEFKSLTLPPEPSERVYKTFCGT
ncbi:MAG: YdiU family protein [Bdellovibrionales bacterium]|nr:YdiU family protein [Bdellovibrionales bacterium]